MPKSSAPAAKTAAELVPMIPQADSEAETAAAQLQLLTAQDTQIAQQGIDALRRHHEIKATALLRCEVAKAAAKKLRGQHDEVHAREAEEARQRDYDGAGGEHESSVAEILALADEIRPKIASIQTRARRASAAVQSANANLPAGQAPLRFIENDPRLAAGKLVEETGLFFKERPVTAFDPKFWIPEVPAALPVTLQKKTEAVVKKIAGERKYEPGDFRQPKFVTLPRFG